MFFEDPSKRYPNLVQALNVLGRRRFLLEEDRATNVIVLSSVAAFFGGWALSGSVLWPLFAGCVVLLIGSIFKSRSRKPPPVVDERAIEATEIAKRMGMMLTKRRLHRDLDEGSLMLLEECARHWARARAALEGPFWTAGQVPAHYQSVRTLALSALDQSMDEVMLHYRDWVPDEVPNRHALDYVDEALEQFTMKGSKRANFPPAAFGPVRVIADKLRHLGDEAESLAREARVDPEVAAEVAPGRSLDQTLSELRQIREAEDELRQNLRG
ncbi:hypothetical protein [Fimbriimonas ginsengisoli]|uniref:Uncharacterized protein n=1 Tax=Fimbriimonas ginsengisoli Gsoil 348 TaxID=661478 RepID=A0A068NN52_FIMGI|nr:hypothetical protein [Fimbriimonas ginsengisoli]AIE84165.1 hypothetical protein OP10G_0797 [Fimbriimonas ginsengisoli Gsoil 348]